MKQYSLKKLFAFIIAMMMFSVLPQLASAQKNKPCPPGYKWECHGRPPIICGCVKNGNGKNTAFNSTSQQSIATNFELELPSSICIKIYDATGRLIKTLTDNKMQQGSYQLQWDSKDEVGKAVPAGIYVLQFFTNSKSEVRKLSLL